MPLTRNQRQILFALGQFYHSLNQPLVEKPLRIKTSKIAFIELLLKSGIVSKQERAAYKNLETLENKKLIAYVRRMITFTERGLWELDKISDEVHQFDRIKGYFQRAEKPKRRLQTMIEG